MNKRFNRTRIILYVGFAFMLFIGYRVFRDLFMDIKSSEEAVDPSTLPYYSEDLPYEEVANPGIEEWPSDDSTGLYINRKMSVTLPTGSVLYIGTDDADANGLYINPVLEPAGSDIMISDNVTYFGFFVLGGKITYSNEELLPWSDSSRTGCKSFYIPGRTYDKTAPAAYVDPVNYGIRWTDINYPYTEYGETSEILIRIVRFPDYTVIASVKAVVEFTDKYRLVELKDNDVLSTEAISANGRDVLIEKAFRAFQGDGVGFPDDVDMTTLQVYKDYAVVEKTDRTYFNRLYGMDGAAVAAGTFTAKDIYAVNIIYPQKGTVTFYAAPSLELMGLSEDSISSTEDLTIFGYDPLTPFSESTLAVPFEDKEFFLSTKGTPF